jgi:hypothetical protein
MEPKEFRASVSKSPFRPFVLNLINGKQIVCDSPEPWCIAQGGYAMYIMRDGDKPALTIPCGMVVSVEPYERPVTSPVAERFATHLNRQPFRPFKLGVAGGWDVVIDAPEFASIDRRGETIRFHAADGTEHVIDTRHVTGIVAE